MTDMNIRKVHLALLRYFIYHYHFDLVCIYLLFRTSKIVTTAFVANWCEIVLGQAMKQAKLN